MSSETVAVIIEMIAGKEFLMEKCKECDRLYPHQQILRFNRQEFQEWQALQEESMKWRVLFSKRRSKEIEEKLKQILLPHGKDIPLKKVGMLSELSEGFYDYVVLPVGG
ncbi:MAG: hypothetical protein PHT40_04635 [Patescibacteria group bacterium]|nr:hypothetical protein [Patescibacteria group bacterium]